MDKVLNHSARSRTAPSMRARIARLAELAATLSGRPPERLAALAGALTRLDPDRAGEAPASRALNGEGLPLELAVTARAGGLAWRLVADPACTTPDPSDRFARACDALDEALALSGTGLLAPAFDAVIRAMLPGTRPAIGRGAPRSAAGADPGGTLAPFASGPFCLAAAAAVEGPGVAIYIDARTPGPAAAGRVLGWLRAALPDPGPAEAALRAMAASFALAAVGIEGRAPGQALAKLYWRPRAAFTLADLPFPPLRDPRVAPFLGAAMRERRLDADGLMVAAGYRFADGALYDAKLNLCGHCLRHGRALWPEVTDRCAEILGVAPPPVARALAAPGHDMSFVTLGLDVRGAARMNAYIRPTARRERAP